MSKMPRFLRAFPSERRPQRPVGTVFTPGDRTWGLECPLGPRPAPARLGCSPPDPTLPPLLYLMSTSFAVGALAADFLLML